jgi:triosephosphate isomerase
MAKHTTPIIVGNWKTNPDTLGNAITFIKKLERKCSSVKSKLPKKVYYIASPDIFIPHLTPIAKRGGIGSQNVSGLTLGQVTGVTVPSQLLSGGAHFTLIGHSEVRKRGETLEERTIKVKSSLQSKLTTILCLGEKERDKHGTYLHDLEKELQNMLGTIERKLFENLIIAYEPVWAIGGKVPATQAECFEVVIALRRALASFAGIDYAKKIKILYGGTVTPENARSFIDDGGVDGLLIGRSSQDVESFFEIITSCHSA